MIPANLKSRTQLDTVATSMFSQLRAGGFLAGEFRAEAFHRFKLGLKGRFVTTGTTITPIMERVLFGLADAHRPRRTVALGSFEGYALAYLAAHRSGQVVGYDIDPGCCQLARQNLAAVGLSDWVTIKTEDAFAAQEEAASIDLLYVDVEAGGSKAAYLPLLETWYPRLRPGALVLAHDISVEKFQADLAPYMAQVRDKGRFSASISLRVDFCGLEVTRV